MPLEKDLKRLELMVPTYYGAIPEEFTREYELPEFGEPNTPVLIHEAGGVRIILGTHDYDDLRKPDIQIERRPKGWAIFLHPDAGRDASGFVYFLDDGRSFLLPEYGPNAIEVLDHGDAPPEIDSVDGPVPNAIVETPVTRSRKCLRCQLLVEQSDDWYGDICPECADKTDGDWVCHCCGRRDNFEAMGGCSAQDPTCCGFVCKYVSYDDTENDAST